MAGSKGMDREMLFFVAIYQCDFATRWRKVEKGEERFFWYGQYGGNITIHQSGRSLRLLFCMGRNRYKRKIKKERIPGKSGNRYIYGIFYFCNQYFTDACGGNRRWSCRVGRD